jgi:hypothetical protein
MREREVIVGANKVVMSERGHLHLSFHQSTSCFWRSGGL